MTRTPGYTIPRHVPMRASSGGKTAQANRKALAAMDECARICGVSREDLIAWHREQRARVLEKYLGRAA